MLVVCCLSLFPIFFAVITSQTLFYELYTIDENILNQSDNETVDLLLYGSNKFKFHLDCSIYIYIYISKSIKFMLKSERFIGSLI